MSMLRSLLLGTLLSLAMGLSAQAGLVTTGSLPFAGIAVTLLNGTNLSNTTSIGVLGDMTTDAGSGTFVSVPVQTIFAGGSINLLTPGTGFGFSLTNGTYGTFTAASGSIVQQTASFLDLFVQGTFVPTGSLSAYDPTPADVRISINQSGAALSEGVTLSAVPEPSSLALLGIGSMVGFVGVARRRWKKA